MGWGAAERDLGLVAGSKVNRSWWRALAEKVSSSLLGCTSKSTVSKPRNMAISVYFALIRPQLEYYDQLWSPHLEKLWKVQWRPPGLLEGWRTWHMKKGWRNQACSSWRRLKGDLIKLLEYLKSSNRGNGATFFTKMPADRTGGSEQEQLQGKFYLDIRKLNK